MRHQIELGEARGLQRLGTEYQQTVNQVDQNPAARRKRYKSNVQP
jgi:hypothetical protein